MKNLCRGALSPCWHQAAFSLLESKINLSYSIRLTFTTPDMQSKTTARQMGEETGAQRDTILGGQTSLYNAHLKFHGGVAWGWLLRVAHWERGEQVGEEHMVFFWGLVRFSTGSNFPTRSVVDTEEDSNSSTGWPSLPQLIRMPLTGTLDWGKSDTRSKVRGYR